MDRCSRFAAALTGVTFLVAACADSEAEAPAKDSLLAESGFVRREADTPERMAALKALPPHQFVLRNSNGSAKYIYADPTACGCIYVGGQRAYDQYRQTMTSLLSQEQLRAVLSTAPLPGESGL